MRDGTRAATRHLAMRRACREAPSAVRAIGLMARLGRVRTTAPRTAPHRRTQRSPRAPLALQEFRAMVAIPQLPTYLARPVRIIVGEVCACRVSPTHNSSFFIYL